MKIIQMLVTLQKGDAIGNFTLKLYEKLNAEGYDTEIYAYNISSGIKTAKNMSHFKGVEEEDLIIYQMCEGHMINEIIKDLKCKKMAIYHNITPAKFFEEYGKMYYEFQNRAVEVISSLKDTFDHCVADSEFNKTDLISMGYEGDKIKVLPLIIDFDDYQKDPDMNIIEKYKDDYVNILFVGRIVQNKKFEDIIRIFAYYHRFVNPKSRLFLIGSFFIPEYTDVLQSYIAYLGLLDSVIMPGHSSFAEILGYYRCADVFLCMSEHEGFCVPLVEAMMFDVPIVAFSSCAVPQTLGGSGVLTDNKDPKKISRIIDKIVSDTDYCKEIIWGQRERLKYFAPDIATERYMEEIRSVAGEKI